MTEDQAIKARNFTTFIQMLEDGRIHHDLSKELIKINEYLLEMGETTGRAAKGKLVITLDITRKNHMFEISSTFKTTLPQYPRDTTVLWADSDGNFTPQNVNQFNMEFQPRQVQDEAKETHSL